MFHEVSACIESTAEGTVKTAVNFAEHVRDGTYYER